MLAIMAKLFRPAKENDAVLARLQRQRKPGSNNCTTEGDFESEGTFNAEPPSMTDRAKAAGWIAPKNRFVKKRCPTTEDLVGVGISFEIDPMRKVDY